MIKMIYSPNETHWRSLANTKLTVRGKSVHDCHQLLADTLQSRSVPYRNVNESLLRPISDDLLLVGSTSYITRTNRNRLLCVQ